jgi:hypothetical protein
MMPMLNCKFEEFHRLLVCGFSHTAGYADEVCIFPTTTLCSRTCSPRNLQRTCARPRLTVFTKWSYDASDSTKDLPYICRNHLIKIPSTSGLRGSLGHSKISHDAYTSSFIHPFVNSVTNVLTRLSNTGQILSSLAAEMAANNPFQTPEDASSCSLLEEATGFFNRCFSIQQAEFAKFEEQMASADMNASSASVHETNEAAVQDPSTNATPQSQGDKEEQWVSVREPVTRGDVLDTILALVDTLSVLCSRSSRLGGSQAPKFLHTVEEIGTATLLEQLTSLAQLTERQLDGAIAQAGLVCAVSEATYRLGFPGNDFQVCILGPLYCCITC